MTGPKEEKQSQVHSYITTLALVAWISWLSLRAATEKERAGSLSQTEQFYQFKQKNQ